MKILHLDIETAPNLAHAWRLWKTDVALNQLIVPGYILSWAAKWDGSRESFFERVKHDLYGPFSLPHQESQVRMLKRMRELLMEADAVVTYNGGSFDLPWLNSEFIKHGLTPVPPIPNIDLMLIARKVFYLPSYKLEHVASHLGVGHKVKHEGHTLWKKCMADDAPGWKRMERYNRGDVRLQERVYHKMLPWIPNHPNRALYTDDERPCCPNCGSTRLKSHGLRRTTAQVYRRYVCLKCGKWMRDNRKIRSPIQRRSA